MKNNTLAWLQEWYAHQCNGTGLEGNGILIQSLEKPEWMIKINLQVTYLQSKQFQDLAIQRSIHDWLICKVQDDCFYAHCGLHNLIEVIDIFRDWALSTSPKQWTQKFIVKKTPDFKMLSLFLFREDEVRN
jgi:hypothetical protein